VSQKTWKEIQSWVVVILIVLVLRATFVEGMLVPTQSMDSTIFIGDAILFNRFVYGIKIPFTNMQLFPGRNPKPGNIIAFKSPVDNRNLVKRCIGLEGDTIQIINKMVYVNGKMRQESYTQFTDHSVYPGTEWNSMLEKMWESGDLYKNVDPRLIRDNFGPVIVPKNCVFMMGDNRDESFDGRFWGPLNKQALLGKPLVIYMSIDLGGPRQNMLEIIKFWQWKGIRVNRIGKAILS
jgi:signal peptidase I